MSFTVDRYMYIANLKETMTNVQMYMYIYIGYGMYFIALIILMLYYYYRGSIVVQELHHVLFTSPHPLRPVPLIIHQTHYPLQSINHPHLPQLVDRNYLLHIIIIPNHEGGFTLWVLMEYQNQWNQEKMAIIQTEIVLLLTVILISLIMV